MEDYTNEQATVSITHLPTSADAFFVEPKKCFRIFFTDLRFLR